MVACRADQSAAEKLLRARLVAHHQSQGVTFRDPDNTFLVRCSRGHMKDKAWTLMSQACQIVLLWHNCNAHWMCRARM